MNRTSILLGAIFFLLIVLGVIAYFGVRNLESSGTPTPATSGADANNPFGSTMPFNSTSASSTRPSQTVQISTSGGEASVSDFTKAPDVASSSEGFFLISYPPTSSQENIDTAATSTPHDYEIFYFPATKAFTVLLLKEPLADTRLAAAADLADRLGISAQALCALKYEVNVPYTVNPFYSAKNLGFPDCPGAVSLPAN